MIKWRTNWINKFENNINDIVYVYNENGIIKITKNQQIQQKIVTLYTQNPQIINQQYVPNSNANIYDGSQIYDSLSGNLFYGNKNIMKNLLSNEIENCVLSLNVNEKNNSIESVDIICSARYMEIFSGDLLSTSGEYVGTASGELLENKEIGYCNVNILDKVNCSDIFVNVDDNAYKNCLYPDDLVNNNGNSKDTHEKNILTFKEKLNYDHDLNNDVNNGSSLSAVCDQEVNNERVEKDYINDNSNIEINVDGQIVKKDYASDNLKFFMLQYSFEEPASTISLQFKKLQDKYSLSIHSIHITICRSISTSTTYQPDLNSCNIPNNLISLFSNMLFANKTHSNSNTKINSSNDEALSGNNKSDTNDYVNYLSTDFIYNNTECHNDLDRNNQALSENPVISKIACIDNPSNCHNLNSVHNTAPNTPTNFNTQNIINSGNRCLNNLNRVDACLNVNECLNNVNKIGDFLKRDNRMNGLLNTFNDLSECSNCVNNITNGLNDVNDIDVNTDSFDNVTKCLNNISDFLCNINNIKDCLNNVTVFLHKHDTIHLSDRLNNVNVTDCINNANNITESLNKINVTDCLNYVKNITDCLNNAGNVTHCLNNGVCESIPNKEVANCRLSNIGRFRAFDTTHDASGNVKLRQSCRRCHNSSKVELEKGVKSELLCMEDRITGRIEATVLASEKRMVDRLNGLFSDLLIKYTKN